MPTTIRIPNFDSPNLKSSTLLDADASLGATSITLKSLSDITTGDFAYLGTPGSFTCEKVTIGTLTPATVSSAVGAILYLHRKNEPLTDVRGDQVKLYRVAVNSATPNTPPADINFSTVGSPTALDSLHLYTDIYDATGGQLFWYKYTYYNSTTGWESDLNDSLAALGADSGRYCTLDDIRTEAGFRKATFIADQQIELQRLRAEQVINGRLSKMTTLPLVAPFPPQIEPICRLLAAGYLMLVEYGAQADNKQAAKNGEAKVMWAEGQLKAMVTGDTPLLDINGVNITSYSDYGNFPTDTTSPKFTINQIF